MLLVLVYKLTTVAEILYGLINNALLIWFYVLAISGSFCAFKAFVSTSETLFLPSWLSG